MSLVADQITSESVAELMKRVRRLEDVEAIRKLFIEYGKRADSKDWEGYSGLFGESGTFDSPHSIGTVTGAQQLRERLGSAYGDDPADAIHLFHNVEIDVDGDRATAKSFWTYLRPGENGYPPQVLMSGRYEDVLVRTSAGWRFELRQCRI
jgi:hypothetical protein